MRHFLVWAAGSGMAAALAIGRVFAADDEDRVCAYQLAGQIQLFAFR